MTRSNGIPKQDSKVIYDAMCELAGLIFDVDHGRCSSAYYESKSRKLNKLIDKALNNDENSPVMIELQHTINEIQIARNNGVMG